MAAKVTRRDSLNGIAIGTAGVLAPGCSDPDRTDHARSGWTRTQFSPPDSSSYYPPTLTGMRGSHEDSFEVAHALAWRGEKPSEYEALDEHYDLVVVGAGLSGLASARYYQQKMGREARILLLDNHDDFGGHAKRNEFHQDGKMILSLGGAQNLEGPSNYSDAARHLLEDIGIDDAFVETMARLTSDDFALVGNTEANNGISMPGPDGHVTVAGNWNAALFGGQGYAESVKALPLPDTQKRRLIEFLGGERDFLDDLSLGETWDYINGTGYNQFFIERVGLSDESLPILNALILHLHGLSGWHLSVAEAITGGAPGIKSIGWTGKATAEVAGVFLDSLLNARMFPDGNASVARLLVHKLIPRVAPDLGGPHDVAVTHFHYRELDRDDHPVRLRLNSTVVSARETNEGIVEVDYVQATGAKRVTASHCVLACYNALIPHLCPEMPQRQKEGLSYGEKTPFVYANVQLKNGRAWSKLGASFFQCPFDPFQWLSSAPKMTVGGYEPPMTPEDPMVVFMMNSPLPLAAPQRQTSGREQLRMGRHIIYNTSFADYEQQIRNQLQAVLGAHGFNHETDIQAITVNRIPHGYAYPYLGLDDPSWPEGQAPHEIGRVQFGRISIANTDSEAIALMDAAFDAAWRAVQEQTA
jgi:spermidine dehydrogenase